MTEWLQGDVISNGISIHYHRAGSSANPAIVLLHGFTDNGLCWSRVAHDLENAYDVVMIDARGHGQSQRGAIFAISAMADDTAAVIRGLKLDKPFLFGHSMGAAVAMSTAAAYPDLVRAILLEDPPLFVQNLTDMEAQEVARVHAENTRQDITGLKALSREERIALTKKRNPNWHDSEVIPQSDSKAEFDLGILEDVSTFHTYRWRDMMARIPCPILLITGDPAAQAIVSPELAAEAARLWKQGEIAHIAGAGHCIHRDRYEEAMGAVKDFLKRH